MIRPPCSSTIYCHDRRPCPTPSRLGSEERIENAFPVFCEAKRQPRTVDHAYFYRIVPRTPSWRVFIVTLPGRGLSLQRRSEANCSTRSISWRSKRNGGCRASTLVDADVQWRGMFNLCHCFVYHFRYLVFRGAVAAAAQIQKARHQCVSAGPLLAETTLPTHATRRFAHVHALAAFPPTF